MMYKYIRIMDVEREIIIGLGLISVFTVNINIENEKQIYTICFKLNITNCRPEFYWFALSKEQYLNFINFLESNQNVYDFQTLALDQQCSGIFRGEE